MIGQNPSEHLNPNCVLVSRTGQRPYESCKYCELALRDCIQFRGQGFTTGLLTLVGVLAFVPAPVWVRALLALAVTGLALAYLVYVNRQSHDSILAAYKLRMQQHLLHSQKRQLERANKQLGDSMQELSDTREQLLRSARLGAMGQLAGGVAHDFNNLLSGIMSFVSLASESLPQDDPLQPDLDSALDAASQAGALTDQLLAFARKRVQNPMLVDVRDVVSDSHRLLSHVVGEDILMEVDLAEHACVTRADPGQLQQVVMNLAVNARDAMPAGGRLALGVSCDPVAMEVHIRCQDWGTGIEPEHLGRIFEPFYTTKESGGNGLGLATCHGIVDQLGGRIEVDSHVGEGTCFRVVVPGLRAEAAPWPPPREGSTPPPGGGEYVLVVEDQELVARAAQRILESAGYEVKVVRDPKTAREAALERSPDLLLTDVVMPGESGASLAAGLRTKIPGLRVLFMSGYNEDRLLSAGLDAGVIELVSKPFLPDQLRGRVREVLDG
jgi:two-component system, cell cycle sensor histidine kinase and response regulator CckA